MLNTLPYPANQVSVQPPLSQMRIGATLEEWRAWTGLEFPVSGPYIVDGALAPVGVDVAADRAEYLDANVWVIHRL
jgi:hypothetical protein